MSWFWAAKLMDSLPNKNLKTRPELHGIHETFIGLIKMYLSEEYIELKNYQKYCIDGFVNLNEPKTEEEKSEWNKKNNKRS